MSEAVQTPVRVLLIDDQPIIAEAVRRALSDAPDLEFHYCNDATKAIARIAEVNPMVILQDLVMPGIDGFALLQSFERIRQSPVFPSS